MIKILMVEDDLELAEILSEYLEQFNIKVETIDDPFLAVAMLSDNDFDLVILDLTLPGLDGLEVCVDIRKRFSIPIIISSARHDIADKVEALERGADDYMPKPYDPRELEARIKNLLRRKPAEDIQTQNNPKNKPLFYDNTQSVITLNGTPLTLTKAELGILKYLINKESSVVSRDELIYNIDAVSEESTNKSIDVIIGRIRHKIGDNPKDPTFIHPVRGIGYKLIQS